MPARALRVVMICALGSVLVVLKWFVALRMAGMLLLVKI